MRRMLYHMNRDRIKDRVSTSTACKELFPFVGEYFGIFRRKKTGNRKQGKGGDSVSFGHAPSCDSKLHRSCKTCVFSFCSSVRIILPRIVPNSYSLTESCTYLACFGKHQRGGVWYHGKNIWLWESGNYHTSSEMNDEWRCRSWTSQSIQRKFGVGGIGTLCHWVVC